MLKGCAFLGDEQYHSEEVDVTDKLMEEIVKLITEKDVTIFYVSNAGQFEMDAYQLLLDLQYQCFHNIKIVFVVHNINDVKEKKLPCDSFMFLPSIESGNISDRNKWLIKHTDYIIAYNYFNGIASEYCRKAGQSGVNVIELAE